MLGPLFGLCHGRDDGHPAGSDDLCGGLGDFAGRLS
jgi:hypothetical protein